MRGNAPAQQMLDWYEHQKSKHGPETGECSECPPLDLLGVRRAIFAELRSLEQKKGGEDAR